VPVRQHFITAATAWLHLGRLPRQARVDSAEATRAASSLPTIFDAFTTHRLVAVGIYLLQERQPRLCCWLPHCCQTR
jgi:hypothetical protein